MLLYLFTQIWKIQKYKQFILLTKNTLRRTLAMPNINEDHPRRPKITKITQQNLPTWQPIISAHSVLPIFYIISVIFIQIGVGLFLLDTASEYIIDYTHCLSNQSQLCSEYIEQNPNKSCMCTQNFTLNADLKNTVYMYYYLDNYYQNFRWYTRSRDPRQLSGKLSPTPSTDCAPYIYNDDSKPIVPCGSSANSIFNDTIYLNFNNGTQVKTRETGMIWETDRSLKFHNPPGDLKTALQDYGKPINWQKELYELDPDNPENNGLQNEHFIIWMRLAPFSDFRKLYRVIDGNVLKAGDYTLNITYQYPTVGFGGHKKIILLTTTWMGGKHAFINTCYITVGIIYYALGNLLLLLHVHWQHINEDLVRINPTTGLSRAAAPSLYSVSRI